jgi:hypothetical protein
MEPADSMDAHRQDDEALLRRLDGLARLLDERFAIPGTPWRIGLDGLLGFIPGVGDVVAGGLSLYLLMEARRLGLPRHLQARMLANIAADVVVGSVPVVGDLFDIAFKANRRNLKLLRDHLAKRGRPV